MNASNVGKEVTKEAINLTGLLKKPTFHNACEFLGDNPNAATVTAVTIAAFKGIFRPLFTMMDKKQDSDTKTYAAVREGLTELVAIPTYILAAAVAKKGVVDGLCKKYKAPENLQNLNTEGVKYLSKKEFNHIEATSKFIGVCIATLIIPAVCNVIQKPVMDAFKNYQDSKKAKKGLDINLDNPVSNGQNNQPAKPEISNPVTATNKPSAVSLYATAPRTSGMRVGN